MNLEEELIFIIRDELGLPDAVIRHDTTARDLAGWDSMRHLQIIIRIEKKFNIRFMTKDILNLQNIGELLAAIRRATP